MARVAYEFEWDPVKARTNFIKRADFEQAAPVFMGPRALTIRDDQHSETERRWITLGKEANARYVLVVHTFEPMTDDRVRIRLISARRPTRVEIRSYEEQQ